MGVDLVKRCPMNYVSGSHCLISETVAGTMMSGGPVPALT